MQASDTKIAFMGLGLMEAPMAKESSLHRALRKQYMMPMSSLIYWGSIK
jgi:hypothetical protein